VKKLASATDPLWYKDAIIYELHVRAFADSNNDGIGDFPGLISKLDYLQDLGVTCLWLLPFFPSPLRDDGYDISNYTDVNPSYGTLSDFKAFLAAAHQRNMQVMIELVINHTSDQHPWFKAARMAPPGSPQREMYVWSETDQLYKDARIIFTDTEKSNWTWDESAKAFYWHRFFSHQPDLNYNNPLVFEEVLKAMRFWLDMGVDALRMDAIPYLCERDGTSCENLPETHAVIKKLRAAIDAEYANRLILAEANQWPADVRPYFGDGDECHMAFHFPLMPRIYMALRQEDRLPITDIMAQTPPIPDSCQWALFLRNHDELTLEMVTDDERDYMYFAYSADPRMRVNVGIRRRLAPLVDNNRRRIELLNSLLLSFPGTPVLYYGDEIGMGDNIYLGDRNGVRTPMQWTSDRNGGFSKSDPARLYLPVIMDPIYGYQVVNVEAQLSDQSSLLHWTHNMIALRKLFRVFGRGTLTFLNPANRKILAYLRDFDQGDGARETVLCVANLSRFAQPVALDLSNYAGMQPVEMQGYVPFPVITEKPYELSLAPYSFLWLELHALEIEQAAMAAESGTVAQQQPAFDLSTKGWAEFLRAGGGSLLESSLPGWLPQQRWFGGKVRVIRAVRVREWTELPSSNSACARSFVPGPHGHGSFPFALFYFDVEYTDGPPDFYQAPLAISTGAQLDEISQNHPRAIIATFRSVSGYAILHDASVASDFHRDLLDLIVCNSTLALAPHGIAEQSHAPAALTGMPSNAQAQAWGDALLPPASVTVAESSLSPAPLSAQPGEAAAPPRSIETTPAPGADRRQPRESPTAGNPIPPRGRLDARASTAFAEAHPAQRLATRLGSAEQSNTSIHYGRELILKLFRRLEAGRNPDVEVGRFLTETAHFAHVAPLLGEISITPERGGETTVAMLQGFIANEGDGWEWFLAQLAGALPKAATLSAVPEPPPISFSSEKPAPPAELEIARVLLNAAALLGRRTGQLHLALASSTENEAFSPEPFTHDDFRQEAQRIEAQIRSNLDVLRRNLAILDDAIADAAALALSRRMSLIRRIEKVAALPPAGQKIRIHGDFHLGQTLRTVPGPDAERQAEAGDFVLIDFEGEPARPLAERRRKQSPLKDVAGMIRSFSYAAQAALDRYATGRGETAGPAEADKLAGWTRAWQAAAGNEFLYAYRETVAAHPSLLPPPQIAQPLLEAYLLEKALYELLYELNNRPGWLSVPLAGILSL
jgi:maltose alpha-D-glucosyltransferase/alpha-amylase